MLLLSASKHTGGSAAYPYPCIFCFSDVSLQKRMDTRKEMMVLMLTLATSTEHQQKLLWSSYWSTQQMPAAYGDRLCFWQGTNASTRVLLTA